MSLDGDAAILPAAYLDTVRTLHEDEELELEEALRAQTESIRNSLKDLLAKRAEVEAALDRVDAAIAKRRSDLEQAAREYYIRKQGIASNSPLVPFGHQQAKGQQQQAQPRTAPDAELSTGVHVVSSTGLFIGDVTRIQSENPIVEILLDLPVLRPVTVRRDWNTHPHRLATIYDQRHTSGTGKPVRWVAVMIQATGDIRKGDDCCGHCARHMWPFEDCIMPPGHPFRKCGNCEWAKRTCIPSDAKQAVGEDDSALDHSGVSTKEATPAVEPITRANLTVRHDGKVYTHPECMEGVPVEKIDPNHPYWDPEWDPDLLSTIRAQTIEWKIKLEEARHSASSVKFSKNRQVNRGETMLEFLEKSTFHPFQLVAKKYMDAKRLAAFDTLFRLAETIRTLSTNGLDVTPEEWLRHRLQQIITETEAAGLPFDLARTIATFYNDPQMTAFREERGIKTIGRPAGYKMAVPPRRKKRKTDHDTSATGSPATGAHDSGGYNTASFRVDGSPSVRAQGGQQQAAAETTAAGVEGGAGGAAGELVRKRRKHADSELSYEGFTDTDARIGDRVTKHDFALRSVKSRAYATTATVTQYWHWVEQGGGEAGSSERVFQHQVFLPCEPPQWGLYSAPVNFHFGLQDVEEIAWAPETLKVMVRCVGGRGGGEAGGARGDMIGDFARERTKRRFLVFCLKKGLRVVKTTAYEIEQAWEQMKVPVLGPLGEPQGQGQGQAETTG
ncbi:hypothetical protein ACRALDRAFT_1072316 [Sodiomyces alcalophilus JCM 7366]|uniref:uncharacterized protein n=1 Tax=Sodiomyces alcalophilus JCM 7366 TaxID=591952 RepID=UPI0039B4F39E